MATHLPAVHRPPLHWPRLALSRVKALRARSGAINLPNEPRPIDQLPARAAETTAQNPWPVSVLSQKFYGAVERWPSAWVTGQITQINTRRAGSAYITLRDDFEDIAMEVNGFGRFAAAASQFVQATAW